MGLVKAVRSHRKRLQVRGKLKQAREKQRAGPPTPPLDQRRGNWLRKVWGYCYCPVPESHQTQNLPYWYTSQRRKKLPQAVPSHSWKRKEFSSFFIQLGAASWTSLLRPFCQTLLALISPIKFLAPMYHVLVHNDDKKKTYMGCRSKIPVFPLKHLVVKKWKALTGSL